MLSTQSYPHMTLPPYVNLRGYPSELPLSGKVGRKAESTFLRGKVVVGRFGCRNGGAESTMPDGGIPRGQPPSGSFRGGGDAEMLGKGRSRVNKVAPRFVYLQSGVKNKRLIEVVCFYTSVTTNLTSLSSVFFISFYIFPMTFNKFHTNFTNFTNSTQSSQIS